MTTILVSGLINIETTLQVDAFPIPYFPVRYPFFGVRSTVSGVGYNIAKALTTLGDSVRFVSMIGGDALGQMAKATIRADGLPADLVLETLRETPQSVILFDHEGRRQINVDLKDIQEQIYPEDRFIQALDECDLAVLSNINFSRPMLRIARDCGIPIATDVHAISDLEDEYNQDFMAAATILFTSHEHLPCAPEEWVRRVQGRYGTEIVVGLGTEGALLAVKDENVLECLPAVYTRPVVNTVGAGDALFSAFVHGYAQGRPPRRGLQSQRR